MFKKLFKSVNITGAFVANVLAIVVAFGVVTEVYTPYVVGKTIETMQPAIEKERTDFRDSVITDVNSFKESMQAKYIIKLDSATMDQIDFAVFNGMERYDLRKEQEYNLKERLLLKKVDAKIDKYIGLKVPVINRLTGELIGHEYAVVIEGKLLKYWEPKE